MYYSVKDKANLLSYNVWSVTDYSLNMEGFTHNNNYERTTEYSVNGDWCVKLLDGDFSILRIPYEFDSSNTYKLTVKCKNGVSNATIETRTNNGTPIDSITLPVTDDFANYTLSFTPSNNETMIVFRSPGDSNYLYVDDISLVIL